MAFRVSTQDYGRLLEADGRLKTAKLDVILEDFGTDLATEARLSRAGAANLGGETGRALFAQLAEAKGFKSKFFIFLNCSFVIDLLNISSASSPSNGLQESVSFCSSRVYV